MPQHLVIFDLDGTLLDTAPDLLRALNTVLGEQELGPVDRSAVEYNFGHGAKSLILEGFRRAGRPLGQDETEPLVHRFLEVYGSGYAIDTRPYPGALTAMDRLAAHGVGFAVCTNKRAHLAGPLLEALGIRDRFAAVIGGDSLGVHKPDPGHILGTIAAAGADAATTVMIGDSDADILAAKGAGVPVIAVSFGYSPDALERFSPDAILDSYDDLERTLLRVCPAFGDILSGRIR